jgi:hypothetical protein
VGCRTSEIIIRGKIFTTGRTEKYLAACNERQTSCDWNSLQTLACLSATLAVHVISQRRIFMAETEYTNMCTFAVQRYKTIKS